MYIIYCDINIIYIRRLSKYGVKEDAVFKLIVNKDTKDKHSKTTGKSDVKDSKSDNKQDYRRHQTNVTIDFEEIRDKLNPDDYMSFCDKLGEINVCVVIVMIILIVSLIVGSCFAMANVCIIYIY